MGEEREREKGDAGIDNTFLRRHIRLRKWQNGGRGIVRRTEMREREPGGGKGGFVRKDGSLIGLHNIDSITGEFFAALRASSTLS